MRDNIKKTVLRVAGLSLLISAVTLSNARAEQQKVGVVGAANQILAAMDESKTSRILALGKDVYFNDTLSTDDSGNAQIMFLDKSALTIGPNASVVVDKFVYNPADGGGELTMRGTKGAFRFIGGALSKKHEVKFKTPVGTIGIRGGIAIVEINPTSGATNATFLYGDKMTFQNLAGQMQETSNAGFGISLASATAMPSVPAAVDSAALAAKVTNFVGTAGQNGGSSNIPTGNDMEKKSSITSGDRRNPDGKGDSAGETDNNKLNNKATPTDKKGSQNNKDGAANKNNSGNTATRQDQNGNRPAGQDGGYMTADGGFVDKEGTYHTPAEVAKHIAEHPEDAPGAYNGGGDRGGRAMGGMMGGPMDPGKLTADGGFVDANGVHHSAAELATFRAGKLNDGGYRTVSNGPTPIVGVDYVYNKVNTNYTQPINTTNSYNNYRFAPNPIANYNNLSQSVYDNAVSVGNNKFAAYLAIHPGDYLGAQTQALAEFNNIISNGSVSAGKTTYPQVYTLANVGTGYTINTNLIKEEMPAAATSYPYSAMNCSTCSFVTWGVWIEANNNNGTTATTGTNFLVPKITGNAIATSDIPNVGTVNYTGKTFSNILSGGNVSHNLGTFTANISLGAGSATLNSFTFDVPGSQLTSTASKAFNSGAATFSGLNVTGANGYTGTVNGALFGSAAENIGGNMNFTNGTVTGAGVYLGKRP